ncbi:hypothetical protein OE88DRAFT_1647874 [Heliocybe sulcata]|uniref:F-box domain-containing protein n=1 Tax=Heliocybe sulcata TaxID=5364 RepID=A0A5C3N0U7_9AGAM|nr:hypothetical protein OE88DRAFT_1647874 [Heliocybe sulcata]
MSDAAVAPSGVGHGRRFATVDELPLEILLSFVTPLIPKCSPPSPVWQMRPEYEATRIAKYRHKLRTFMELARVSRAFKAAVEYCLYTTVVIFHDTDVANLAEALQRHGSRVRILVYDATLRDFPDQENHLDRYSDLNRCLAAMPNLHTLKVVGSHILFMPDHLRASWQTVQPEFPNFPLPSCLLPPIRVLRWKCQSKAFHYDKQLLHAISLLSSSLEELSVDDWNTSPELISTISKPLPRLKTLQLVGGDISLKALSSLLDLAITTDEFGEKQTSLKTVVLWDRRDDEGVGRERAAKHLLASHPPTPVYLNYTVLPMLTTLAPTKENPREVHPPRRRRVHRAIGF